MKELYKGVIPALATPINEDETIDEKGVERLIEYHLSAKVRGIFLLGSMGEFAALEDKEKEHLLRIAVKKINGKVPVFAGVSDTGTKRVIRNILQVKDIGIQAVVALPPYYYFLPAQEEIFKFYSDIAKATNFPIVIYNNPIFTKISINFETISRLSKIENIIGIKDTSCDYAFVLKIIKELKSSAFFVLQGDETRLDKAILNGADGMVTGVGTLAPYIFVSLYEAAAKGNREEAHRFQEKVNKLREFCSDSWIAAIKYGLKLLGICGDYVCRPSCRLDEATKNKVETILRELKILP